MPKTRVETFVDYGGRAVLFLVMVFRSKEDRARGVKRPRRMSARELHIHGVRYERHPVPMDSGPEIVRSARILPGENND